MLGVAPGRIGRVGSAGPIAGGGWWQSGALAAGEFVPAPRFQQNGVRADSAAAYTFIAPARYVQKANGDWMAAAANDPAPTGRGVQIEGAATNTVPSPYDLSGWGTQSSPTNVAFGETVKGIFTTVRVIGSGGSAGSRVRQTLSEPAVTGVPIPFVFRYKEGTSGRWRATAEAVTGGNASTISGPINAPAATSSVAGTWAIVSNEIEADGWRTLAATFTPNFDGGIRIGAGPDSATAGATVIIAGIQTGLGSPLLGLETRAAVQMTLKRTGTNDWRLTADNGEEQFFLNQAGGDFAIVPANLNRPYLKAWSAFLVNFWPLLGLSDLPQTSRIGSADVRIALIFGQSGSIGGGDEAIVSTSQPYASITFAGGPRALASGQTAMGPLVEVASGGLGETLCSGFANYVNELRVAAGKAPIVFAAIAPGEGAKDILELSEGGEYFERMIAGIAKIRDLVAPLTVSVDFMVFEEGEEDSTDIIGEDTYADRQDAICEQINRRAKAVTGQPTPVHVLVGQVNRPRAVSGRNVSMAVVKSADRNPLIHFYGSKAQLGSIGLFLTADQTHCTPLGHNIRARHPATLAYQILEDKEPSAFVPRTANVVGSTVYVLFSGSFAPKIDTVNMAGGLVATNYGIRIKDDTGSLTLTNIRIEGGRVAIDINRALGANPSVRFALDEPGTAGYAVSSGQMTNITSSMPRDVTVNSVKYRVVEPAPCYELAIAA